MTRCGGRTLALVMAIWVAAVSLPPGQTPAESAPGRVSRGGTLRVGLALEFGYALDPQKEPFFLEIFRCCLLRTLLSYNGRAASDGGTELFPDLASGMPSVSADGLTWTFHLKRGIHYAPPYQDTTIVAQDFIRALEREATSTATPVPLPYYHTIAGFDDFAAGRARTIPGLAAPDPYTLMITLTVPTGDLGARLAVPAAAPIPPSRRDPTAPFGAADGHDGTYGPYLVASGPYMIEGSQWLDFSRPPEQQRPVFGLIPGQSLTLVRNPSWNPATDPLRPAYPDRIVVSFFSPHAFHGGGRAITELRAAEDGVVAGRLDLVGDFNPLPNDVDRYRRDPELSKRLFVSASNALFFADFRLTIPPFDDVHVRRAASYAIVDKEALYRQEHPFWPTVLGTVALHLVPDSLEESLLSNYDPYPANLEAAREEMRRSQYDRDHDGICDSPVCQRVPFIEADPGAPIIARDLRRIGIKLQLIQSNNPPADPRARTGIAFDVWFPGFAGNAAGYPSASELITTRLEGRSISNSPYGGNPNFSLIGATPEELKSWGYRQASVPSVDQWIDQCRPLIGARQTECWAELDQFVMEHIVPWIPIAVPISTTFVSSRVRSYSFDQAFQAPALDRIALPPGSH